jgi:hypothetical protein
VIDAGAEERSMVSKSARELRERIDAAWQDLTGQLEGMDAHLERADAPGEWTTREVLSHLLFEPGFDPVKNFGRFAERNYPLIEISPGDTHLTDERRGKTLAEFRDELDAQRLRVLTYLDGVAERELERKARIPLFKQFMGTDEIAMSKYIGALFDYHWHDHAGQLAKIRQTVGLAGSPGARSSAVPI